MVIDEARWFILGRYKGIDYKYRVKQNTFIIVINMVDYDQQLRYPDYSYLSI